MSAVSPNSWILRFHTPWEPSLYSHYTNSIFFSFPAFGKTKHLWIKHFLEPSEFNWVKVMFSNQLINTSNQSQKTKVSIVQDASIVVRSEYTFRSFNHCAKWVLNHCTLWDHSQIKPPLSTFSNQFCTFLCAEFSPPSSPGKFIIYQTTKFQFLLCHFPDQSSLVAAAPLLHNPNLTCL